MAVLMETATGEALKGLSPAILAAARVETQTDLLPATATAGGVGTIIECKHYDVL